jgi:hypothetical protein
MTRLIRGTVNYFGAAAAGLLAVSAAPTPSVAQLSISQQFNFSDVYGVNPIGNGASIGGTGFYLGGLYDSVGANSITPSAGTTVTASQNGTSYLIPFVGGPGTATPNEFYRNLPLDTSLVGPWTLTAVNGGQLASVDTLPLNVTTPPPLVTGVSLSGSGTAPTVSWTVPPGSAATAQTVYVFDVTPGTSYGSAVFKSADLSSGANTYTLPTGTLTAGHLYSISVQSDVRTGGVTGDIEARSRSFTAAFTATNGTFAPSTFLPTVSPTLSAFGGPIFQFNAPVTQGAPISIDPPAATGFIYEIGTGDPNFASVELPDVGNPSPYDLYLWNGSQFVFDTTLDPDTVFDFGPGGVSEFEILGISTSVGLNPNSATDFVTQLTFTGSGTFTGTMTPIINVPEASTWAMLAAGFGALSLAGYQRSRRTAPAAG